MDDICDFIKSIFPTPILFTFPILLLLMPVQYVDASTEFSLYRMQQFQLYGAPRGCRGSAFSLEAKSLANWRTSRHCVITRLKDITSQHYDTIAQQAGALLVMLPKDMALLTADEKNVIIELEQSIIENDVSIPVYFLPWNKDVQNIIQNVEKMTATGERGKRETAVDALFSSVFAMGYQIVVNAPKPNPIAITNIPVIQGKLSALGTQGLVPPTIVITANIDAQSPVPEISFGADSNGSGVAVLLELARLFSKLYSKNKTQPRYNLAFLLSGGGKLSYIGSKKWLDKQFELLDSSDDSTVLLKNVAFVLCLDSITIEKGLNIHVSKPPKNGTVVSRFIQELKTVGEVHDTKVEMIHKKINLANQILPWEHERFSMKRIPAFTVSALSNHKDPRRASIFDNYDNVNYKNLYFNTKLIADALAKLIYGFSESNELLNDKVEMDSLKNGLKFVASHPRSNQLLTEKDNSLVISLHHILRRYMSTNITFIHADKNEPEFVIYDVTQAIGNIYNVKPAVFDLFLTAVIGLYIALVYALIQNFPMLYSAVQSTIAKKKSQ